MTAVAVARVVAAMIDLVDKLTVRFGPRELPLRSIA